MGLAEVAGRGRTSLALMLLAAARDGGQPVAWVDGTGGFCPATAGLDPSELTLVRTVGRARSRPPAAAARFGADVLLRSRAFSLVVLDLPGGGRGGGAGRLSDWFRLGRLAARARSLLLLLHEGERPLAGSASELALAVRLVASPGPPWADLPPPDLELRLLRHRAAPERQGQRTLIPGPRAER